MPSGGDFHALNRKYRPNAVDPDFRTAWNSSRVRRRAVEGKLNGDAALTADGEDLARPPFCTDEVG